MLARKGIAVELPPKQIEINSITVTPTEKSNTFKFLIECKGGTYVRSICRDVAYALNTYATMTKLFRKKSGLFTEKTAVSAENFNSLTDILNALIPPENTVNFTSVYLNEKQTEDILNGRHCFVKNQNGLYKVFGNNEFIGVGQIEKNNLTIKAFIKD